MDNDDICAGLHAPLTVSPAFKLQNEAKTKIGLILGGGGGAAEVGRMRP